MLQVSALICWVLSMKVKFLLLLKDHKDTNGRSGYNSSESSQCVLKENIKLPNYSRERNYSSKGDTV